MLCFNAAFISSADFPLIDFPALLNIYLQVK